MVTEKKIGLVGGCAIAQRNIPKENRFIEIFKTKMKSHCFVEPSFTFSSYSQFHQLESAVERIMDKKKVELLILHIRPQPFLLLSKLIIKDLDKKNKTSFFINPLLLKKTKYQNIEKNPPQVFNQLVSKPKFMSINILFGKLLGMNIKASKLIFDTISKINSKCIQSDIKLVILGMPPAPMTKQGNLLCKKNNDYLSSKCHSEKILYLDTFSSMNHEDCFLSDKLHLSKKGHNYLGSTLFEGMKHFTTQNKQH